MNTRNCNDGIFDWFPMVQRFTRSFLDRLFAYKDVKDKKKILDPFMGSGNTLLACLEHGKIGYGVDISPLFCFISHVETNMYAESDFKEAINVVKSKILEKKAISVPQLSPFNKLFDEKHLNDLLLLKEKAYDCDKKTRELLFLQ